MTDARLFPLGLMFVPSDVLQMRVQTLNHPLLFAQVASNYKWLLWDRSRPMPELALGRADWLISKPAVVMGADGFNRLKLLLTAGSFTFRVHHVNESTL